jgi:HlyD family secretion protein
VNKHVPSNDEMNSAETSAPSIRGEGAGIQKVPPPKPAEAKSPTPQQPPEKPQAGRTQPDEPRRSEADGGTPGRARDRITLAGILGALIVGAFLWWSWGGGGSKTAYVYSKATYSTVTLSVSAAGTLAPHDSLDIKAPLGGRVESVLAKSGQRVKKGEVLARLQSDSARDELLLTQTELATMQARVAQAEADVTEARAAASRAKTDPKPGAYDGAQATVARAAARMSELQAELREAEAHGTAARAQIDSLNVRAPFDGIVLKSDIEPGQYVSAATGGRALLTLASGLSQLKLVADIPESQLGSVHVGEPARFTVAAFPRREFPAILTALDLWPKKETKDGKDIISYPATISADNPDGVLRPGMTANATIIIAEARNALVVPNQALIFSPPPDIESKYPKPKPSAAGARVGRVWVLNGEDPEPRAITLGLSDGRITQVAAGSLRAGEKIITSTIQ